MREWGEPGFVALLARRCRAALDEHEAHVVFTAHSLPARILDEGDTYPAKLLETASLVAGAAGIGDEWSFSFQSESATGEPWLNPTSSTTSQSCASRGSTRRWSARSGSSPTTWRSAGTSTK